MNRQRILALIVIVVCALLIVGVVWANGGIVSTSVMPAPSSNADLQYGVQTQYGVISVKKSTQSANEHCASYMTGSEIGGYGILGSATLANGYQNVLQPIVQGTILYLRPGKLDTTTFDFSSDSVIGQYDLGTLPATIEINVTFPDGSGAGVLTQITDCSANATN